ncbi:MAG: GerMN domain-containing protein [Actinomycetota bacterium]|jgi:spore germination protein GerM|nr:GerMN domain-containing protein [Actinomycetota bacterium]
MKTAHKSVRAFVMALLVILLIVFPVIAGCSSDDGADGQSASDQTSTDETDQSAEDDTTDNGSSDDADQNTPEEETDGVVVDTPKSLTVVIYFTSAGENALGIEREIPYTQAVASATMKQLLSGLTDNEAAVWPALSSQIPEGTELLGLTIDGGVASVDLSEEFDDGGGSFSVTARVAQVVYTLCQFSSVDSVEFYMEGELIEIFTGEGLLLEGPQTPEEYYELLPIDA